MKYPGHSLATLGICWLLALVLPLDLAVAKKKKGSGSQGNTAAIRQGISIRKQLAAQASRVLQAAVQKGTLAESNLRHHESGVAQAVEGVEQTENRSDVESRNVGDIEGDILSGLAGDSPYRRAEAAYLKASEDFARAQRNALGTSEYRRAYEIAKRKIDSNQLLAELRRSTLEGDSAYAEARARLSVTKTLLGRELSKLLSDDPAWLNAVDVSRNARTEEAKARQVLQSHLIHKLGAKSSRNEALKVATQARQTLHRAQYEIERLEQALQNMQRSQRSRSGSRSRSNSSRSSGR